jgi:hypothetical protein
MVTTTVGPAAILLSPAGPTGGSGLGQGDGVGQIIVGMGVGAVVDWQESRDTSSRNIAVLGPLPLLRALK